MLLQGATNAMTGDLLLIIGFIFDVFLRNPAAGRHALIIFEGAQEGGGGGLTHQWANVFLNLSFLDYPKYSSN